MKHHIIVIFILVFSFVSISVAQQKKTFKDRISDPTALPPEGFLVDFSYGIHLPFADLAENFKYNFTLGGKVQYIFSNNLMIGLVGDWQFCDRIKTDVVSNLREPDGSIIDKFGNLSDVALGQRGFFAGLSIGYLLPVMKKTKRSGIEFRFSGGYEQHWVRIEVLGGDIFALSEEYKKGYDRRTSGFAMTQYVGYRHLDKNRLLNFFGGFDFMQAFNKNRRGYNFDTGQEDSKNRVDLMLGFRIGLTLPIYVYTPETQEDVRFY